MVIHNSGLNLFLYLRETARAIIHTLHRIECLVFNRIQKLGSVHYMMGSSISSILVQVYTGWASISRTDSGMSLCVYEWKFC